MIYMQVIGCGVFLMSTLALGIHLRRHQSVEVGRAATVILHLIALATLLLPLGIGIFYPGLGSYDRLLGLSPLPLRMLAVVAGAQLMLIALFLLVTSWMAIAGLGQGQPGVNLTKKLVGELIYKTCRNPMSLGFYLACIALGLMAGSTYWLLWTLLEVIPVHIFYLKFFEELELEIRFGEPYLEYQNQTSFLIPRIKRNSSASG